MLFRSPAFIFLQLAHPAHHLMDTIAAAPFYFHPRILWAIAVLFMMCAILRLARFNVETDEEDSHEFFSGLPSPAAGGVVASLPIGMSELKSQLSTGGSLQSLATFERYIWSALVVIVPLVTVRFEAVPPDAASFSFMHAATMRSSTLLPLAKAEAVVPSCARTIVNVSVDRLVTLMISSVPVVLTRVA